MKNRTYVLLIMGATLVLIGAFTFLFVDRSRDQKLDVEVNVHVEQDRDSEITTDDETPPIYVTVVTHNEEPRRGIYPDFVNDEEAFWEHREAVVNFSELMNTFGVAYHYQSDWNFLLAATIYDNGTNETNGKNFLRYLYEDLGTFIDPHAHESEYSYADVAYLIEALGVPSSHVVGGFIAAPAEDSKLNYLLEPIQGRIYPEVEWSAEILWGGATSLHNNEEGLWYSGVWRPQDAEHFDTHDSQAPLPYVGGHKIDWAGLDQLLIAQAAGELESGKMYTQTIMVTQLDFMESKFIKETVAALESYQDQTKDGLIEWIGFEEIVDAWEKKYDGEPTMRLFDLDG